MTPLRVYLDQNKWIDLAKVAAGRADGTRFAEVLEIARCGSNEGLVVFPLARAVARDVVVTARHGAGLIREARLDQRHETVVLTDLADLSKILISAAV